MLNLNKKEWGEFAINDLFNVSGTITTHPSKLISEGCIPRITCSSTNNGLENTYANMATENGGVLTVDSATVGFVSYQEADFIATDHVEKIFNTKRINILICFLPTKYCHLKDYLCRLSFSRDMNATVIRFSF